MGSLSIGGYLVCRLLLLFELDPILILLLLRVFMVPGNDFQLVEEDMLRVEAIFIDQQQGIILNRTKSTS